jgi:hypothetical protein
MPNFAAIGRSRALSNVTGDLLNVAALIRQEKTLKMQEETHDIVMSEHADKVARENMTSDLGPAISNRGSQVPMENAIQSHRKIAADNEERAAIEQEKADEMQVQDVDSLALMREFEEAELPSAQKALREWGVKNGLVQQVGGRMVISNKNKKIGMEMLAQDFKFKMVMNKAVLLDASNQKNGIKKELADMKESGKGPDDKKYAELQQRLKKAETIEAGALSNINLLDDTLRRAKALKEEKESKRLTRKVALEGDKIRNQESYDGGKTWTDVGRAYSRFKATGGSKDISPDKALKRISAIVESMATLEKTDRVTQMMAMLNPKLKAMIGQKIDPALKARVFEQWEREITYLETKTTEQGDLFKLGL